MRASKKDLDQLNGRPLAEMTFVAVFIDGTFFADHTCLVALGIAQDGKKVVLGVREGASENAELVKDLLQSLQERGLVLAKRALFVLDGSKALGKAVRVARRRAGRALPPPPGPLGVRDPAAGTKHVLGDKEVVSVRSAGPRARQRPGAAVHVARTRRYGGHVYETHLLRRSHREDGTPEYLARYVDDCASRRAPACPSGCRVRPVVCPRPPPAPSPRKASAAAKDVQRNERFLDRRDARSRHLMLSAASTIEGNGVKLSRTRPSAPCRP